MKAPASFLRVYDAQNGMVRVAIAERATLERAVDRHLDRGNDAVLRLKTADGATYSMFVRDVRSWAESTPAIRARGVALERMLKDEERRATRRKA